jgi:tetratricopeptide (TPR) repeat protein
MSTQAELFEPFRTAEAGTVVFCHQDFLQKVHENRKTSVGKRASLLLERLVVDPRREFYKSTLGANKGWRRSRLGGNGGNHFYAWWAPQGAPPLRGAEEFDGAPEGAVFLRDIRHHDDHSELRPQSLAESYLAVTARDLRTEEYSPSPLTPAQAQFATARQRIRIIKGYPGSGKTTALWHAADQDSRRATLYVTYSPDLAALAQTHFRRFAPAHKEFHVLTFSRLLREITGEDTPVVPERESRERFLKELAALPPRVLGPWVDDRRALYDEIHANLVGAALPITIGRFTASEQPRVADRAYREQRRRYIGGATADAVLEVVNTIARRQPDYLGRFFPELVLAWKAVEQIRSRALEKSAARKLIEFDCIAVDEAQDLTPMETLLIAELSRLARERNRGEGTLLFAGDEAQTVRPTDFEWGWFHDILHHRAGSPQEFKLAVNLRSPRRIARLINAVWGLYSTIAKQDRPSGWREAEIEDESSDQLVYCAATRGAELEQLLRTFGNREGLAIICLADHIPDYVPADLKSRILTVNEAKGLDFQSVCILDPGERLQKILNVSERIRRDAEVEPLSRRLAIDQLRVAVSRPAERIYFLDVGASEKTGREILSFLKWASDGEEVAPAIPAAVVKTLEEELLEPEERVRLCEIDARQFLEVKPEMAWARAKQAVSLLGKEGMPRSVTDETVRQSAHLTQAQVSFVLAMRATRLARELGDPDLFQEAAAAARQAGRKHLSFMIGEVAMLTMGFVTSAMVSLLEQAQKYPQEVEPWFAMELKANAPYLLRELEKAASNPIHAVAVLPVLPAAYKLYDVLDGDERAAKLRRTGLQLMIQTKAYAQALQLLDQIPDASPHVKAECYEGMGRHREAAELYQTLSKQKEALRNYRAIPDAAKALALMKEMGGEQAAVESLEWMSELEKLIEKRPKNFARVASAAEKKRLTEMLEGQLDGPRKPRKPAVKRAAPRKKRTPTEPRP